MGGHHGKHSSENRDAGDSSKVTPGEDPTNEKTTFSAQHGNLLLERKFSLGNKAVKEQFIRDKILDASCCATESSKKTFNETKLPSNVNREIVSGSPSANTDIIHPTTAIVTEFHGPQNHECVKSCSPVKGSHILDKEHCPQTSPFKVQLKETQYLRHTIKSQRRVATRSVIGTIDLIKKTHDQFETIRKENETSFNEDSNQNVIKSDPASDVVSESVRVKKKENIDRWVKMVSHLDDDTNNTVILNKNDSHATDKKKNCSLLTSHNDQVLTHTQKANVIQNTPHGPNYKLRESKMKQSVNTSLRQTEKIQKPVTLEQPTSKNKDCIEKKVCPTPVLLKKDKETYLIGQKIAKGSEIQPITIKKAREMPTYLSLPHGTSPAHDGETLNERSVQKAGHKIGGHLEQAPTTHNKKITESTTVPCKNEVKPGPVTYKQIKEELRDPKPLQNGIADPPNPLRVDTGERKLSQDGGETKCYVEPKSGGRIDKAKDSITKTLQLEGTENTKLESVFETKEKADEPEKLKDEASSRSTQAARAEPIGQVQTVTKKKMTVRETNVVRRRKKVKLKPPFVSLNKQGNMFANSVTSQKSICQGIDSNGITNRKEEATANVNEPKMANGEEKKQASKCGEKPQPLVSRQGKTDLKSPTKAHPPRSPAGDSIGRMVDPNNKKPIFNQELKTVSDVTQQKKLDKPEEAKGVRTKEDPKDVNFLTNDNPDKSYEKHVTVTVDGDATKSEDKSPNIDLRKRETKREKGKNKEKKKKGDDECVSSNQNIEKLVCQTTKAIVAENVCLVQKEVPCPVRPKILPSTETGVPTDKKDLTCDIRPRKAKLLVHEKEIRTKGDVTMKRKLRIAVRKGPIPKGQPTLMDIIFCQSCGDTKQPNGQGLFHCPKCKSIFYCTRACQHNDAKRHKKTCTGVKRVFCKHV